VVVSLGSVLTVLTGLAYWGSIVASDARNADATSQATSGVAMGTFFGIWTVAWALMYACTVPGKGVLDKGPVLAVLYTVIVLAASWLFLRASTITAGKAIACSPSASAAAWVG